MKKYMIRSVGWIFDDDWYNYDGEHDIEGVYDSKEEANERCQKLNSTFFLYYFEVLYKYQINLPGPGLDDLEFVDVSWIAEYLVKELNINKEDIWDRRISRLRANRMVLSQLNLQQIESILQYTNLTFFKIFEFNSEELFLLEFKRNEAIWGRFYDKDYHGLAEHYYYFYDDRDQDQKRVVSSIIDCYQYALCDLHASIESHLLSEIKIRGTLRELSKTPQLLQTVLTSCMQIDYLEDEQRIVFKSPLVPEELMRLDAVLKQPILLWEKIPINQLQKVSPAFLESMQNQVEIDFGTK